MTAGGIPRQLSDEMSRWQPKGRYESIVLVFFLCMLLVVAIVNIMGYLAV